MLFLLLVMMLLYEFLKYDLEIQHSAMLADTEQLKGDLKRMSKDLVDGYGGAADVGLGQQ